LAWTIKNDPGAVPIYDIYPRTIGICVEGGRFTPLIQRSANLPTEGSIPLVNSEHNQRSATLEVWEGNSPVAARNDHICTYTIDGLPPRPPRELELSVKLALSLDGILSITARVTDMEMDVLNKTIRFYRLNSSAPAAVVTPEEEREALRIRERFILRAWCRAARTYLGKEKEDARFKRTVPSARLQGFYEELDSAERMDTVDDPNLVRSLRGSLDTLLAHYKVQNRTPYPAWLQMEDKIFT
jgi:molecular chaperone DnaK (HSP70)